MCLTNRFTIQEIYLKLDLIVIKTLKLETSNRIRLFQLGIGAHTYDILTYACDTQVNLPLIMRFIRIIRCSILLGPAPK